MSTETEWRQYAANFSKVANISGYSESDKEIALNYGKYLFIQGLPIIYDAMHLAQLVGYSLSYIYGVTNKPSKYYRKFFIKKKNGSDRLIVEPLPSLKAIQRWILDNILSKIPLHPAAKAYRKNGSIKENARFHRGQSQVLCIDLKDFFPSISSGRVFNIFRGMGYSAPVSTVLTKLCILDGCLPQGAPSSPTLSNISMRNIDKKLFEFARSKKLRYTRYADDLTFSGSMDVGDVVSYCEFIVSKSGFRINDDKTRVRDQRHRQLVTGIVVNEKLSAPKCTRKDIRKYAYYIEKYGFESHTIQMDIRQANYRGHLMGLANFVLWVNPQDRDANNLRNVLIQSTMPQNSDENEI